MVLAPWLEVLSYCKQRREHVGAAGMRSVSSLFTDTGGRSTEEKEHRVFLALHFGFAT